MKKIKKKKMKKIKKKKKKKKRWKVILFVVLLLSTLMILSLSLRAACTSDTILNLVGVLGFVLWILFSIATNCLTFKNKKDNERKN